MCNIKQHFKFLRENGFKNWWWDNSNALGQNEIMYHKKNISIEFCTSSNKTMDVIIETPKHRYNLLQSPNIDEKDLSDLYTQVSGLKVYHDLNLICQCYADFLKNI